MGHEPKSSVLNMCLLCSVMAQLANTQSLSTVSSAFEDKVSGSLTRSAQSGTDTLTEL
jgi:hypothetical protein